jgi:hypothetical protein
VHPEANADDPKANTTPFYRTTEREVIKKDNDFVYKIMKRDRRYRPTAKELLEDEWCMTALFSETGSAPAIRIL